MELSQGFEPVFDQQSRVLILGSHPGVPSLRKQQYYGNPGNAFWRVVYGALGVEDPQDYDQRLAVLRTNGLAVWDVYAKVEREGSLDSKIKFNVLNDFERVLSVGNFKLIIANGKTAYQETQKHSVFKDYEVVCALSTSGLNNGREIERMAQWQQMIHYGLSII